MDKRMHSLLEIKSVDQERRILTGIASTPTPDSYNDIVEVDGIEYSLPLPFLYQHNSRQPIGNVIAAKKTKDALEITVQIAKLDDPTIAPFIEEAWALMTSKPPLIRGLSIGFRALEESWMQDMGGFRIIRSQLFEVSAVTIPANQEATILAVKSADSSAASGIRRQAVSLRNSPGVSGSTSQRSSPMKKSIAEQIAELEAKRAASSAQMTDIMGKASDEGRTLSESEIEAYDALKVEVKTIDDHLVRLKDHEAALVQRAAPISRDTGSRETSGVAARQGSGIQLRSQLPVGTTFSRYVMAIANTKGNLRDAAEVAKELWKDSTPEVELMLRAAINAGTATDTTWASPLIPAAQQMQAEFLELLRPATIIGRIPGLRRVPFNIAVPAQTGGGTYGWVGEAQAKPVSALAFAPVTLSWAKIAGIIVLTKELVRFSNPAAEQIVRNDMVNGVARYMDVQFVDPTVAAVANVNPASITNGVAPTPASGTTAAAFRTDMRTAMGLFIAGNDDPSSVVVLMSASVALNLSLLMNALGQPEFPNISISGGTILGLPVIVSQNVGARIILAQAGDILIADDGPVEIDVSEQASIVMDSAPQLSPVETSVVSLWQRNYIGLRVDKMVTWKKGRSTSVQYISNAVYSG